MSRTTRKETCWCLWQCFFSNFILFSKIFLNKRWGQHMGSVCGWRQEGEESSWMCATIGWRGAPAQYFFPPKMCGFTFYSLLISPRFPPIQPHHRVTTRERKKRATYEGWMLFFSFFRTQTAVEWGWGETAIQFTAVRRRKIYFSWWNEKFPANFFDRHHQQQLHEHRFFAAVWFLCLCLLFLLPFFPHYL